MSGDTETPSLAEALVSGPRVCDCEGATRADEDGCCVSCGLDHRAFETPTLTTEQARVLAARWADALNGSERERAAKIAAWLTLDEDRELLFAWVRARMAEFIEDWQTVGAPSVAHALTLYPETRCELARHIAQHFDWEHEGPDEETQALALCEAAGWPS